MSLITILNNTLKFSVNLRKKITFIFILSSSLKETSKHLQFQFHLNLSQNHRNSLGIRDCCYPLRTAITFKQPSAELRVSRKLF